MSDKPQNKAKSTDRIENKALDKPSTNPELVKESQTDAKGQQAIELQRSNKNDGSAGGFDEIHRADGGITLKGVIPGPGEELANITTGTMEALAPENALVKNALEMRRQLDQHMD